MRRFEVEVIARPVEIDRKEVDARKAKLLTIRLKLYKQHLLGEPVGSVRLLGIAGPEIFFAEGDGREFRVGADGADADEFLHVAAPACFDEMDSHDEVVVKKGPRMPAVGADAADLGREMENDVRADFVEQSIDLIRTGQIAIGAARNREVHAAMRTQLPNQAPAKKAAATGDQDRMLSQVHSRHSVAERLVGSPV